MANTVTSQENVVTNFLADFFREYIRNNRYARYTGTSSNNIICIKEGRQQISIPLVTRLQNAGIRGSGTMRDNGEAMGNFGWLLTPTYIRNAVEFDKEEAEKPAFSFMQAAREVLMGWALEVTRDDTSEAMNGIYSGTTYNNYGDATNADHDAWLTNNADRVMYWDGTSNAAVGGDHSASLLAATGPADKSLLRQLKNMAEQADTHIGPVRAREDEENWVYFCDTFQFNSLQSNLDPVNRDAGVRGDNNRLFRGGDLLYEGIIIRKIPELVKFTADSAGTDGRWGANATANSLANYGVGFFCGKQAMGFGLGQRPMLKVDREWDYGFRPGVAVELKHDIKKMFYQNKQHGSITVFTNQAEAGP